MVSLMCKKPHPVILYLYAITENLVFLDHYKTLSPMNQETTNLLELLEQVRMNIPICFK